MAESIGGGYDYVFITDLPEDLVCTLCHLAFKNPLQIEECGHIFCKLCFDQMVDHAKSNSLDITCPLDRQKIEIARVFKDKSDERKVLNLIVQCPNFGDNCQCTGELREDLVHETECHKKIIMLTKPLDEKLNQILNRMTKLEINSENHKLKLAEKDQQIANQNKRIEHQNKQIDNLVKEMDILVKQMKHQSKPTENQNNLMDNVIQQIEDQNKKTEDQNKKIENQNQKIDNQNQKIDNQNRKMEDQGNQIDNLVQHVNTTHQCKNDMIIKNIGDDSNYSPINSAFQWKFKPDEISYGDEKFSPPFYNVMNPHCFQLKVEFLDNNICIGLCRYRGKYDHSSNKITETEKFKFEIHIFGKSGKLQVLHYDCHYAYGYRIAHDQMRSTGSFEYLEKSKIGSFAFDGDVNLHCLFKDT